MSINKIISLVTLALLIFSMTSVSANVLVIDSPTQYLKDYLSNEEYETVLVPDGGQIKLENLSYLRQFDTIYVSETIFNEMVEPNMIINRVKDPGFGYKTEVIAIPDEGIISQKTKVMLQRYSNQRSIFGYTSDGLARITYGTSNTKVVKDKRFDIGINHPRTAVRYMINDPTCATIPTWNICWDYTQRR